MKSLVLCGLLSLAMETTIQDKLTLNAENSKDDRTSTSSSIPGSGDKLIASQQFTSANGQTVLEITSNGNLVILDNSGTPLWSGGISGTHVTIQTTGIVVVSLGTTILSSSSAPGAHLDLQDDNNLVVYSTGGQIVWSRRDGLMVNPSSPSKLLPDTQLTSGHLLISPDGQTSLLMQSDGNLVLFNYDNILWDSGTAGQPGAYASLQADGNLVIYQGNTALWDSNTAGVVGAYLEVDDDTSLLIYSVGGTEVWSSTLGLLVNPGSLSVLLSGTQLDSGHCLISPDGQTSLVMQGDGNLVLFHSSTILWDSGTAGQSGAYVSMQSDGCLVIYKGKSPKSSSHTTGVVGAYLRLQDDTNLVVYSVAGSAVWSRKLGLLVNPSSLDQLLSGTKLPSNHCLISKDGHSSLAMQSDGNLVVYHDGQAIWASNTENNPGTLAKMQKDGNFVAYLGTAVVWASATEGVLAAYLRIQDDANLVVYSAGDLAVWSSQLGLLVKSAPVDRLLPDTLLLPGQLLISPNGHTSLALQSDGTLVLSADFSHLWIIAGAYSKPYLSMQLDGNLVIYDGDVAMWDSFTTGVAGAYLQLQDDTDLVVYSVGGQSVWSWQDGLLVNPASPSTLRHDTQLASGHCLISPDGHSSLVLQTDGDMVVYHDGSVVWHSDTTGHPGTYAKMQGDGNFVLYETISTVVWASNTAGNAGAYVEIQDDQNLVIYLNPTHPVWVSMS